MYIGQAKDFSSRIGKHLRGNPQNSSFAKTLRDMLPDDSYRQLMRGLKVSMLPVADPAIRDAMERRLIADLQPGLNKDGVRATKSRKQMHKADPEGPRKRGVRSGDQCDVADGGYLAELPIE